MHIRLNRVLHIGKDYGVSLNLYFHSGTILGSQEQDCRHGIRYSS